MIVRVTDNGEGVESSHLTRLFERFYRVDKSGSREEGGSGLGLSIVKHIIEAHEEKIYVESKFGIGSEFSFTLQKQNAVIQITFRIFAKNEHKWAVKTNSNDLMKTIHFTMCFNPNAKT